MSPNPVASYMNSMFIGSSVESKVAPPLLSDAYSSQQYLSTLKSETYTDPIPTEMKSGETKSNLDSLIQQAKSPLNCITLEELNSSKMPEEGMLIKSSTCYLIYYVII